MIKIVILDKDILNIPDVIKRARKEAESEVPDFDNKNFIFLDGPEISDLVVVESNVAKTRFLFRKCTDDEWGKFFRDNLSGLKNL